MGPEDYQAPQSTPETGSQPPAQPPRSDWQQGLGGITPDAQPQPQVQMPTQPIQQPDLPQQPQVFGPTQAPEQQPVQPIPNTPPVTPQNNPMVGMPVTPIPHSSRGKRLLIALLALVVVVAIGVAGYFLFLKKDSATETAKKSTSSDSSAKALATLTNVSLSIPSSATGDFTETDTGISTIKQYTSSDSTCVLIAGTLTEKELPGENIDAIINPQLDSLREAGATIDGPDAGKALIVTDSASSSTKYSMPTLKYEFSEDNKHAVVHYSAVILKSGQRAVVNRTCVNADGTVDEAKLTNLDNIAAKTIVTEE